MTPSKAATRPAAATRPQSTEETAVLRKAVERLRHDGPYLLLKQRHQDDWAVQDEELQRRLAALATRYDKPPNIILVLADGVGWGELGCYLGGKLRGTPTAALDKMAADGMKFLSAYASPSGIPSRVALLTGRLAVRTEFNGSVLPGGAGALDSDEVTLAEVLSAAGYDTAMWGQWGLGAGPEDAPERQGFDQAHYGLYSGSTFAWADVETHYQRPAVAGAADFFDFPGEREYLQEYGLKLDGLYRGGKDRPRESLGPLGAEVMETFENDCAREIVAYVKDHSENARPFFIYWATYATSVAGSPKNHRFDEHVDTVNNQAAQMRQHNDALERVCRVLTEEEIADNTLVVWISDSGPTYAFYPNSGYTWLRGGEGEVTEGGVRVPAIALWPGMIDAGRTPTDLMQIADWFTTVARIGGALGHVPADRVIDGVDQTSLLLMGEGNSRRNYLLHYLGRRLAAVRYNDLKFYLRDRPGCGAPGAEVYNIMRDPGEKFSRPHAYQWMVEPMRRLVAAHLATIPERPDRRAPADEGMSLSGD